MNMSAVKKLLDALLWDIYGKASTRNSAHGGANLRLEENTNNSRDAIWMYSQSLLMHQDICTLTQICAALRIEIRVIGSYLERALITRDKLQRRNEFLCELINEILISLVLPHGEPSKEMRFSLSPPPPGMKADTDSDSSTQRPTSVEEKIKRSIDSSADYTQWLHAMKMVARLPGGMPPEFRRKLWFELAEKYLQAQKVDWEKEQVKCFSEKWREDDEELGIQIVKDLHRTGSSLCSGPAGTINQAKLKRILLGYARYNPEVGYCQGFNMLGALILQVMDKEEVESIKVMIYLVEGIIPAGYFSGSLGGLQADMAVFRDIMTQKLPKLAKHLQRLQGPVENAFEPPLTNVFTMQWFLTMFCNCLPMPCVLRVWDLVLIEGSDVLLRTALAIWSILEERILNIRTADDFYCKMGALSGELLNGHLIDSNRLIEKVVQLGPIPELQKLRDKHLYNISPWREKSGLKLYYSDEEAESDEDSRLAVTTAWGLRLTRRGSAGLPVINKPAADSRDRIALDISLLKKQYDRLRERQKQAHIIITSAVARQTTNPQPSSSSIPVNHLLIGRQPIITNKGRRLGPPKGAIPPPIKISIPKSKSSSSASKPAKRGETLYWRDTDMSQKRKGSLKLRDTQAMSMDDESSSSEAQVSSKGSSKIRNLSEKAQKSSLRAQKRSESSSYSEDSDANSSTSTSLCDEDANDQTDMCSSLENSPLRKGKGSKEVPEKSSKADVNVDSKIPQIELPDIAPSSTEEPLKMPEIDEEKEDSSTESDRFRSTDFSKDLRNLLETNKNFLGAKDKDTTYDLLKLPSSTTTITSTSQLSPMADISQYLGSSSISPLRTPISFFDYSNLLSTSESSGAEEKKFDVNDEGVTNEYFERVIVERPTHLDLLYSLNDKSSFKTASTVENDKSQRDETATKDNLCKSSLNITSSSALVTSTPNKNVKDDDADDEGELFHSPMEQSSDSKWLDVNIVNETEQIDDSSGLGEVKEQGINVATEKYKSCLSDSDFYKEQTNLYDVVSTPEKKYELVGLSMDRKSPLHDDKDLKYAPTTSALDKDTKTPERKSESFTYVAPRYDSEEITGKKLSPEELKFSTSFGSFDKKSEFTRNELDGKVVNAAETFVPFDTQSHQYNAFALSIVPTPERKSEDEKTACDNNSISNLDVQKETTAEKSIDNPTSAEEKQESFQYIRQPFIPMADASSTLSYSTPDKVSLKEIPVDISVPKSNIETISPEKYLYKTTSALDVDYTTEKMKEEVESYSTFKSAANEVEKTVTKILDTVTILKEDAFVVQTISPEKYLYKTTSALDVDYTTEKMKEEVESYSSFKSSANEVDTVTVLKEDAFVVETISPEKYLYKTTPALDVALTADVKKEEAESYSTFKSSANFEVEKTVTKSLDTTVTVLKEDGFVVEKKFSLEYDSPKYISGETTEAIKDLSGHKLISENDVIFRYSPSYPETIQNDQLDNNSTETATKKESTSEALFFLKTVKPDSEYVRQDTSSDVSSVKISTPEYTWSSNPTSNYNMDLFKLSSVTIDEKKNSETKENDSFYMSQNKYSTENSAPIIDGIKSPAEVKGEDTASRVSKYTDYSTFKTTEVFLSSNLEDSRYNRIRPTDLTLGKTVKQELDLKPDIILENLKSTKSPLNQTSKEVVINAKGDVENSTQVPHSTPKSILSSIIEAEKVLNGTKYTKIASGDGAGNYEERKWDPDSISGEKVIADCCPKENGATTIDWLAYKIDSSPKSPFTTGAQSTDKEPQTWQLQSEIYSDANKKTINDVRTDSSLETKTKEWTLSKAGDYQESDGFGDQPSSFSVLPSDSSTSYTSLLTSRDFSYKQPNIIDNKASETPSLTTNLYIEEVTSPEQEKLKRTMAEKSFSVEEYKADGERIDPRPKSCPEPRDNFGEARLHSDRVLKIIEENSQILHRILKKATVDSEVVSPSSNNDVLDESTDDRSDKRADTLNTLSDLKYDFSATFSDLTRSTVQDEGKSQSHSRPHSRISDVSVSLRSDDNIADRLASIKNTIKSIDSLCEDKGYRAEKCQKYIDSLFESSSSEKSSTPLPFIQISNFKEPIRERCRSIRDVKRESSPRTRRGEDREEYESRARRDNLPLGNNDNEADDIEVGSINSKSEPTESSYYDRPISPYYADRSGTPSMYVPAKLQIRHTTVTSTFYDRFIAQKELDRKSQRNGNKSPVSPLANKAYLDPRALLAVDRNTKSAENSPSRTKVEEAGVTLCATTPTGNSTYKTGSFTSFLAESDFHIRSCDNILLQLRSNHRDMVKEETITEFTSLPNS